jgi:hypothetical protein
VLGLLHDREQHWSVVAIGPKLRLVTPRISSVRFGSGLWNSPHPIYGLKQIVYPIPLHELSAKEPLHCGVERGRIIEWNHVRRIRENCQLALTYVMVDLDGVLIPNEVVIARHDQCWRGDPLKGVHRDMWFVEQHLGYLHFAPPFWRDSDGIRHRSDSRFHQADHFGIHGFFCWIREGLPTNRPESSD